MPSIVLMSSVRSASSCASFARSSLMHAFLAFLMLTGQILVHLRLEEGGGNVGGGGVGTETTMSLPPTAPGGTMNVKRCPLTGMTRRWPGTTFIGSVTSTRTLGGVCKCHI